MDYKIAVTERFKKNFKKLNENEKRMVKNKLEILKLNPLHPSLRSKRIKGVKDLFECSVNMDLRIIWYYEGNKIIVLLDIGHHNVLDKF